MSRVQRPEELHPQVLARVRELTAKVQQRVPEFCLPSVYYFDGRAAAGLAHLRENTIGINRTLLLENAADMLDDTVPHEVAHLAVYALYVRARLPRNASPTGHGRHWQGVMRAWFGFEPKRLHSYSTANCNVKRQRRWTYSCSCKRHEVTTALHNKMQRYLLLCGRTGRACAICRAPLTYITKEAACPTPSSASTAVA